MKKIKIVLWFLIMVIVMDKTTITAQAAEQSNAETILNLVNEVREEYNLPALSWEKDIKEASDIRALEASVLWSHTRPDGSDWWTVNDKIYGENLAKTTGDITEVVSMWMDSPSHRANILCSDYTAACIGIYTDTDMTYIALELL